MCCKLALLVPSQKLFFSIVQHLAIATKTAWAESYVFLTTF